MATQAQIEANRANARKSTGPRTSAGKAVARRNATRHGLSGKQIVIQGEDEVAFEALRQDLLDAYKPADPAELLLVNEIAQSFWRLQRARALEAETFKYHGAGADPVIAFRIGLQDFETIRRYMAATERAYHRAIEQLQKAQSLRRKHGGEIGFDSQSRETPPAAPSKAAPTEAKPLEATPIDTPRRPSPLRGTTPRATIKFDPLPTSPATSNNQ